LIAAQTTLAGAIALVAVALGPAAMATASASAQEPACQPRSPDGAVFVTETCVDPAFTEPYTDEDEQRTITDPATHAQVRYRYVHGGFRGTDARFSFYFPSRARYRGLFLHPTYPTVDTADVAKIPGATRLGFAFTNGAYVVATNNGGGVAKEPVLGGYRVNAAAAKYSRVIAARVYQDSARPRGYLYGASGGAYQTLGGIENTSGVWDGAVPMVPGVPNAIPSFMDVQLLALRVLHDKLPDIADALEPGGTGDPFADLDAEQQAVLRETTRLGFPLRGWWQHATLRGGAFGAIAGAVRVLDPTYVDDFWSQPGYEGADPASPLRAARIQHDATVERVVGDPPEQLVLSSVPDGDLVGADVVLTSGAASGKSVLIGAVTGNTVTIGEGSEPAVVRAIRQGDAVRVDNSWVLALQHYQRHAVPTPDQYGWNQFRDAQGAPASPQRPSLVGPKLAGFAGGAVATGRFDAKMIMLASVMDVQAFPWSADWYRQQVHAALSDRIDDSFRLWYMDNADHVPPEEAGNRAAATHIVGYEGELERALLDLDAWVTNATAPPATSDYEIDSNDQVQLPATSERRGGVQPTVTLSVTKIGTHAAKDDERAEARVGEPVTFSVQAATPPGKGRIVRAEWNFSGTGGYRTPVPVHGAGRTAHLSAAHTFAKPGTYFVTVRVTSAPTDDPKSPYGLVQNLDRVRVVVTKR
jgi:hypothetical protein